MQVAAKEVVIKRVMRLLRQMTLCASSLLFIAVCSQYVCIYDSFLFCVPSSSKDPFIWGHSDHSLDEGGATTM